MHKKIQDIKHKLKKVTKVGSKKHYLRSFLYIMLGLFVTVLAIILFYITTVTLPDISNFDKRVISQSTKIYDRTGKILLFDNHNTIRRTVIDLDQISPDIINAIISIEDDAFYSHNGFRIKSFMRAVFSILFKGESQGGSTLTQQIVKNTLLTREKTIDRKIKEIIIAIKLENKLSKEEILEIYLNEAPYSGNIYGVEEASLVYFKKKAKDVTIREAAYLASIPQSPYNYDPNGPGRETLEGRADYVLKRMFDFGYITQEQYDMALKEEVYFVPKAQTAIKAPHFVFWVKEYLVQKYGEEKVNKEGLKVTSTLDFELQSFAEEEALKEALKNEKEYGGSNIAVVATDPKTGQVLTMVGSRDFFDEKIDGQYNVAVAKRQPGSSFKPFVYATAFKKGYKPETVIFDVATEFNPSCSETGAGRNCYSPENFDLKYKGPMALRNALGESRNIPSVKLLYLAGIQDSIETARSLGIKTLGNENQYGLSLVLGSGEVKLLEMVNAYGVFANDGKYNEPISILKVEDKGGKILEEFKEPKNDQVLEPYIASAISSILSSEDLRSPTFGRGSSLSVPGYSVAAKTGTTNDSKDAWIVGYSRNISVGVWSGNNDNLPMRKGGAQVSGPLFNKIIKKYLEKVGEEPFNEYEFPDKGGPPILRGYWQGGVSYKIDKISGGLATDFTPKKAITEKIITNVQSILYWVDKDNPTGESPTNPQNDPQFKNWQYGVLRWWNQNSGRFGYVTEFDIPKYFDNVHQTFVDIPVVVLGLQPGQKLNKDESYDITILVESTNIQNVEVFVNDLKIKTFTTAPYQLKLNPKDLNLNIGENILRVVAYDNLLYSGEEKVSFLIEEENLPEETETFTIE